MSDFYAPIDPEEMKAVEAALHDESEVLDPEEGRKYLLKELRKLGVPLKNPRSPNL